MFNGISVTSATLQPSMMSGFGHSTDVQMGNGMFDFSVSGTTNNGFIPTQTDFPPAQYMMPQFMNSPVAGVDPTQEDIWQDFMSHLGLNQG